MTKNTDVCLGFGNDFCQLETILHFQSFALISNLGHCLGLFLMGDLFFYFLMILRPRIYYFESDIMVKYCVLSGCFIIVIHPSHISVWNSVLHPFFISTVKQHARPCKQKPLGAFLPFCKLMLKLGVFTLRVCVNACAVMFLGTCMDVPKPHFYCKYARNRQVCVSQRKTKEEQE